LALVTNGFLPLVAAALLGGGVSATCLIGAGAVGDGGTRTIVEHAVVGGAGAMTASTGAPTAREIYRRDAPGVVFIRARSVRAQTSVFDLAQPESGVSTGSGFVIDHEGHVLTNAHLVSGATDVQVSFSGARTVAARVVGKDEDTDLALLAVEPKGLDLRPLELGSSAAIQVGDPTVAIGNPFGLDRTLTTGVVSAKQRRITAPNGFAIENVIQTDAAINPGNSGGPLIDAAGRVIGINSQIATAGSSGSVGIGFAVPIDTAKAVIPQLKENHMVSRAYLGVAGHAVEDSLASLGAGAGSGTGVVVQEAFAGSPAEQAGIRAEDAASGTRGDVIVALDGQPVRSMADVGEFLQRRRPGDGIAVELLRDGRRTTVQAELAERPATIPLG
jgi:S1-C subfamily serine protease